MNDFFLNLVGNLGALGLIFWLVYRTTSYTLPKITSDFEKSISQARTDYKDMMERERSDFRDIIEEQRAFFASQTEMNMSRVDKIFEHCDRDRPIASRR